MPLIRPSPPKAVWKAYKAGRKEMIDLDRSPTDLPDGLPEPIYVLQLADIAAGHGISTAKPMAWRFYAGSPRGPAVSLTVGEPARGAKPRMTSMSHGQYVQKAFHEVHQVEGIPQVKRHNYELRRLTVPGVLGGLWLASPTGSGDLVLPYATQLHGLKRMRSYKAETFLEIVRAYARKRLAHSGGHN